MSRRVSISLRTARQLAEALDNHPSLTARDVAAWDALAAAMAPKKSVVASLVRRVAKKATKKEKTSALQMALLARARGRCELCGGECSDMHHALSRRVPQDISNVLLLCRDCHRWVTNPGAEAPEAFRQQAEVFERLGHITTARELNRKADFAESKIKAGEALGRAASMTRGAP